MPLKTGFYLLSFNTQPPEGGWLSNRFCLRRPSAFQHTAARRRLVSQTAPVINAEGFQHTAARRRLAIFHHKNDLCRRFNTQPPEGGWAFAACRDTGYCCFNTQPPEGGWAVEGGSGARFKGFNTQPPEGGWSKMANILPAFLMFQHTAARRRLVEQMMGKLKSKEVSTHSRPKAAGV